MSLEQALAENTAALKALAAALATGVEAAPKATKATKAKAAETSAAEVVNATPATLAQPETAKTTASPATGSQATPAAGTASPETMKAIADNVSALANAKGRDAVISAISKFVSAPKDPKAPRIPEVVAEGKADAFLAYVKSILNPTAAASDFM